MLPVNEKSTATSDVILKKALTKLAHHKTTHEGLGLYSAFPWPDLGDEFTSYKKGFEKCTIVLLVQFFCK